MSDRYGLPIDCKALMRPGGRAARVSLAESVREHLLLILMMRYGGLRADEAFGCAFWEYDFESSTVLAGKHHRIEQDIRGMILAREPRLDPGRLRVAFRVYSSPLPSYRGRKMQQLKKRIEMTVRGRLLETNQDFRPPPFQLYFSPVAVVGRGSYG